MMRKAFMVIAFIFLYSWSSAEAAEDVFEGKIIGQQYQDGWNFPGLGFGRGNWNLSVGLFFNTDKSYAYFRNLQLQVDVDLWPGSRYHMVARSNNLFDTVSGWQPMFDENNLELFGFNRSDDGVFNYSLRVGVERYLTATYPDALSMFINPPGTSDLRNPNNPNLQHNGYGGTMLQLDYAHKSGLGYHATGIYWGFGYANPAAGLEGAKFLENYVYFHHNFGAVHFETHVGGLQMTDNQRKMDNGFNVYLGSKVGRDVFLIGECNIGLFYQKTEKQPYYTGLLVTFPLNDITSALGGVDLDIDRGPNGISTQWQLAKGNIGFGNEKDAPPNSVLVGGIEAERVRTYCSNGMVRDYYEHRLSAWGDYKSDGLVVVEEETPWWLQAEAVYSNCVLYTSDAADER
ncbi:MAG: hypothetical protein N3A57_08035, partial [Negativicutes bacterium]|nr:hypothetical protein [Negativicutes bacterium]